MGNINSLEELKSLHSKLDALLTLPTEKVSVVNFVDLLVELAYASHASDIHMEPAPEYLRVRFRIDGMLHDVFEPGRINHTLHQEVIARIKVLSGLRTDEHLSPQDGRFKVRIGNGEVDLRVSIIPTYYGENCILRVLAETTDFELEHLGFSEDDLERVQKAIKRPYGMILANGPTGSGKSTTLYTILKKLNHPDVSIVTIEDPIEYSMMGASQIQINNQVGLTFASGLRSILRQDPNIIMVGEIRDEETASIAVNAALTGHLVLSTLHTNDSATTFPRLIDMKVPPFLVASTVNIAMGQRLVRKICENCKKERKLTASELKSLREILPDLKGDVFYAGTGCDACNHSGFRGRVGIREVLEVTDDIRQLIMDRANAKQIKEAAVEHGMTTMIEDGIKKAQDGVTTLEEVLRIIHE